MTDGNSIVEILERLDEGDTKNDHDAGTMIRRLHAERDQLQSTLTRVEAERDAAFNDGVEAAANKLEQEGNWASGTADKLLVRSLAEDVRTLKRPTTQPEKDKS